jgi:diguanylate cyclase (GGDEF)-like protein
VEPDREDALSGGEWDERGAPDPGRARRIRKQSILRASLGLLLLLVVIGLLDLLGVSRVAPADLALATGLTLGVQALLWYIPHRGWDRAIPWDRHYIFVPMLAAAGLFGFYMHIAPEARFFMLMAWFVALLFTAGYLGRWEVIGLGALMSGTYMVEAIHLVSTHGRDLSLAFEGLRAGVFLGLNVFAGMVFGRIRDQRLQMRELQEELGRQAVTDPLTGLPNRRYFEDFFRAELARRRRYGGECAVAIIDVDDFKNYNDTLGHMAGDGVLRTLADVFREHLRVSDVVARYGGEEFGLIMVNTDRSEAIRAAERLRARVEEHEFEREEIQPRETLTVSVGLACCPADGTAYEELVKKADEALYVAKRRGKNRIHAA